MGTRRIGRHWQMALVGGAMVAALQTSTGRDAWAGCGDGACGRVDWTEVTDQQGGTPVAVKFHGGFALSVRL